MAALSKALSATFTVLSVACLALYLASMLTPVIKMDSLDIYVWQKMCPSKKAIGNKLCADFTSCNKMKSLLQASQAFYILSAIGSLGAVITAVGGLLGKLPSVAGAGAAAMTLICGTITMGVTFSLWTQKQCGATESYSKTDGMKMGDGLKLLIAAYVISIAAMGVAIGSHFMGGSAAALEAGNVGPSKAGGNDAPLRQEPPASTLVPVQAQESQNPLDKQPKAEEPKSRGIEAPKAEEKKPEEKKPEEKKPESEQKRAKVLAIDFEELKRKLPATKGDQEQKAHRFAMFERIDVQAKGALTVEEVTAGLRDVLQVGDTVASLDVVIAKAFAKAAAAGQAAAGNAGGDGALTVEKNEFRLLLLYVRQYFRVFQIFAAIDTTGDNRMALDEFRASQSEFASMGLTITDADATFHAIDADKSGVIDFHEFAMWALEQDGVLSG